LRNNGGPTFTHALRTDSPAIDMGHPHTAQTPVYEQRGSGYVREVAYFSTTTELRADIGAYERQDPATIRVVAVTANDEPQQSQVRSLTVSFNQAVQISTITDTISLERCVALNEQPTVTGLVNIAGELRPENKVTLNFLAQGPNPVNGVAHTSQTNTDLSLP